MTHVTDETSKLNSAKDPLTGADKWHIPPCMFCGPNFLGVCPHGRMSVPSVTVPATQTITATAAPAPGPFIDLQPLIMHFERELQRLRDQLAVERTAASSAREALAKCEERARMLTTQLELGRLALDHAKRSESAADIDYKALLAQKHAEWDEQVRRYVAQIKGLEKRAQKAEDRAGKANCERDAALERLTKERANFESAVDELRAARPEPGSVLAVLEAYRLLVGHEPAFTGEWVDKSPIDKMPDSGSALDRATDALLFLLDILSPGGVR